VERAETYENFPLWIVVVSNLVSWSIYAIGAYILAELWVWLLIPYLLYCLWMEIRVLRGSCVNCYYYGKTCAFGKGRVCAAVLGRGDPQHFAAQEVSWSDVLPDLLVSILPLLGGILLLVLRGWNWLIVVLLVVLLLLAFGGTAIIRGSLACRYCRQRELGCPAQKLFGGEAND
jgi:hypothetical protein